MIAYDVNQKLDDGQASSPRADARDLVVVSPRTAPAPRKGASGVYQKNV